MPIYIIIRTTVERVLLEGETEQEILQKLANAEAKYVVPDDQLNWENDMRKYSIEEQDYS